MQYVMFICDLRRELGDDWDLGPDGKLDEALYAKIGDWFQEHGAAGRIVGGNALGFMSDAKTIRIRSGEMIVTDGPFTETKEVIGGYAVLDVPDLDAAVALAKTWPAPNATLEVRAVGGH
jgi:hypothetical protein